MNLEWRTESWIECQELEAEEAVDKILNYSAMLVWITKGFYSGKQSVFFRFTKAIYHYKRIKEHFSLKVRWKRDESINSLFGLDCLWQKVVWICQMQRVPFLHLLIINRSFAYIIRRKNRNSELRKIYEFFLTHATFTSMHFTYFSR